MKRFIRNVCFASLALGLILGLHTGAAAEGKPTLSLVTPVLDLAQKQTDVQFKGTGFAPGQAVNIVINDADGVRTDIGYALDPEPKADDKGEWATTWDSKRFVEKKLIKDGDYTLTVTDEDYNEIASATVKFEGKLPKKEKKKD